MQVAVVFTPKWNVFDGRLSDDPSNFREEEQAQIFAVSSLRRTPLTSDLRDAMPATRTSRPGYVTR